MELGRDPRTPSRSPAALRSANSSSARSDAGSARMTPAPRPAARRRPDHRRGPLGRLPAVAGLPRRADDHLRRHRQPAARHRHSDDHADWAVPRSAFAPIVSLGYLGMMIGGAIARARRRSPRPPRRAARQHGRLRRRHAGRSRSCTASIALAVLRFVAGIGLGGADAECRGACGRVRAACAAPACRHARPSSACRSAARLPA